MFIPPAFSNVYAIKSTSTTVIYRCRGKSALTKSAIASSTFKKVSFTHFIIIKKINCTKKTKGKLK